MRIINMFIMQHTRYDTTDLFMPQYNLVNRSGDTRGRIVSIKFLYEYAVHFGDHFDSSTIFIYSPEEYNVF